LTSQNWVSLLQPPQHVWSGAGTVLNTAATATISPRPTPNTADYNAFVPAGSLAVGSLIRVTARGFLTTTGTSTTATWFLGSNIGNTGTTYVTLATTNGISTGTTVLTGIQWKLEALIRCTAVATAGTLATQGELSLQGLLASGAALAANPQALTTGASIGAAFPMPAISGETAATVDTTQTQGIALRATLAGANATIQLTQWLVESCAS
jgi:hypothetical protein